ncbi:MAG: protein-export chaperone SecB [Thiogranum sp.]|nr:protein-export chaperone SecB [Thiogranum sp.]
MTENLKSEQNDQAPQFSILRLYLKDVSLETPNSPAIFTQDWKPDVNIQLATNVSSVSDSIHEVVLSLTITAKQGEKTGFLVEVQQAGLFSLKGHSEEQENSTLHAYCPAVLFPYAREAVSDLVTKGGFPPLLLAPVNFDALYARKLKQTTVAASENSA